MITNFIFTCSFQQVERLKVKKEVAAADFVSIISDGTTDIAILEQEMIYLRTCKAGVVSVKFLGVMSTPKPDAQGIMNSIGQAVQSGLDVSLEDLAKKLVALGADGAAVMMGCNTGVVTRLRELAPSLIGVHCFAHRLELAVRDVVKRHPIYAELDKLLLDLWLFYKNR